MPGTTPVYGFPYPEPTDLVADYPALGQDLAEDIEDVLPTIGGLVPAKPTSIANSGGTATLSANTVTFSGVSSVSLNGCFTANYDNYRVLVNSLSSSGQTFFMRMRAAGSDTTTNYIGTMVRFEAATSTTTYDAAVTDRFKIGVVRTVAQSIHNLTLGAPYKASPTALSGDHNDDNQAGLTGGSQTSATQFDGLTLFVASGTLTGTVSVYGYKK